MSTVARTRVTFSGAACVGAGVSTWYWDDSVTGVVDAIGDFYDAIKSAFPDKLTITIPNTGDILTAETGELEGTWTEGDVRVITGTDTGNFVLGTGARLVLRTSGINAGRRVRGSVFLVPLGVSVFNEDDALANTFVAGANAAAATMITAAAGALRVFSPPKGIRPGKQSEVTSASVPDAVSWLRSRRT